MRYISTRGQAPVRDFGGVLLAGLAEDGGLYVPESWPHFSAGDWRAMRGLPYAELAARLIQTFIGASIPFGALQALCRDAYARFDHPAVAPLVQLETGLWVQELFHGPTLAFKDMAMQLLGRLFEHVLDRTRRARHHRRRHFRGYRLGGDRGLRRARAGDVAILHPRGRTSEVQRRQMTTVLAPNIGNIAVEGTFDDCQDLVKAMFADIPFRREMHLSAVNSINWARIAAQIPYYVASCARPRRAGPGGRFRRPHRQFRQCSGCLGGATHGPAHRAADRRLQSQRYPGSFPGRERHVGARRRAEPLAEHGHSGQFQFRAAAVRAARPRPRGDRADHAAFRETGRMPVSDNVWRRATDLFHGFRLDDAGTEEEIRRLHRATGYLADPHTAIGIAAARALPCLHGAPTIAMATAHPAKFPDAIERAVGFRPPLPDHLADLFEREERYELAPNDLAAVEARVRELAMRNTG